jgi:hypothetical protein
MGKPDKKAALRRLTKARENLAASTWKAEAAGTAAAMKDYEQRNREVIEAEKDVRFGRVRGWDYED